LICRLAEPVGRACLAPALDAKMITSVDVCILRASDKWDARFIVYLLSSEPYLKLMNSFSRGGTRDRVSRSFLGRVRLPKPKRAEQAAIADFLDRQTDDADALIAKYKRLLELLEEKRLALIAQAVTKGLTSAAPMKDSGISWIGEVPSDWNVTPISRLYDVSLGKMLDEKRISGTDLVPYLRVADGECPKSGVNSSRSLLLYSTWFSRSLQVPSMLHSCSIVQ